MKPLTKAVERHVRLMQAIRDGKPYSKRWDPLAVLSRADMLRIKVKPIGYGAESATLTKTGEIWLKMMEEKYGL